MSLLLNKNEIENNATMVLDELLKDIEADINDENKEQTEPRTATLKIKMALDAAQSGIIVAIQGEKKLAPTITGFVSRIEDTDQMDLYGNED